MVDRNGPDRRGKYLTVAEIHECCERILSLSSDRITYAAVMHKDGCVHIHRYNDGRFIITFRKDNTMNRREMTIHFRNRLVYEHYLYVIPGEKPEHGTILFSAGDWEKTLKELSQFLTERR